MPIEYSIHWRQIMRIRRVTGSAVAMAGVGLLIATWALWGQLVTALPNNAVATDAAPTPQGLAGIS